MTQRTKLWLAAALAAVATMAQPAHAGFNVCNQFERRIDVAFGYVDRERGWVAQGWWIMDPSQCKNIHSAELDNRYYYLFVRTGGGTTWNGDIPFCIQKKKFLLVQSQFGKNTADDCAKAGLDYAQFFKVDVGGAKDHTYNLTTANNPGPTPEARQPPVAPQPQPPYQAPVANTPTTQQPYQQQAPQTYQQGPPAYQQQPSQPYQQAPQTYRPPVAGQQPSQQAPQPPQYQQAPQPPSPQPPPAPGGGGTACQRFPNLC